MEGCGDGEWRGYRFFTCPPGRGFFCPLANLRHDTRLMSQYPGALGAAVAGHGNRKITYHMHITHECSYMYLLLFYFTALQVPDREEQDQTVPVDQIMKYIGDERGIQGHQNSCYLDATIFGLFALSDVFDSLFLESLIMKGPHSAAAETPVTQVQREISDMLWRGIVNPLRKYVLQLYVCQSEGVYYI